METGTRGNSSGIAGNGESVINKATSSAHNAVNSLAGAADDAARKAKPAIDKVVGMAHEAVDKAAGAAAPAAEWLGEQGENLNAAQKKLMDDTCSYVSANPMKAVGIALVAGFLLSRIIL